MCILLTGVNFAVPQLCNEVLVKITKLKFSALGYPKNSPLKWKYFWNILYMGCGY